MYKVGDRFIIEIEEVFTGKATGYPQYRIKGFDKLVMDDRGLVKVSKYEDEQKQDAEIKVGDEVYSDAFDDKGIVTHITTDKVSCVCIICNGFTMMKVGLCGLHKTGRHFDQIAEVLAELRGAENDE